ncbi:hypothetical protein BHE74_00027458 [Ensete ventricosum]|nr:hypothetical protein BHE74_00027458 [Ensete ventricosum]
MAAAAWPPRGPAKSRDARRGQRGRWEEAWPPCAAGLALRSSLARPPRRPSCHCSAACLLRPNSSPRTSSGCQRLKIAFKIYGIVFLYSDLNPTDLTSTATKVKREVASKVEHAMSQRRHGAAWRAQRMRHACRVRLRSFGYPHASKMIRLTRRNENKEFIISYVPCGAGAERDKVVGGCAGERGGGVVVSVAVSPGAGVLEELGVGRRLASVGAPVVAAAAVLGRPERFARALARHALTAAVRGRQHHLEVRRAHPVEVLRTAGGAASPAGASLRHHQHRQVVAVHQTHVVEVHPAAAVERELRQGRRGCRATAGALHRARPAVSGGAAELAARVSSAVGATPESARPRGGRVEAPRLAFLQREARRWQRGRASAREHAGPYGVLAVICQRKRRRKSP